MFGERDGSPCKWCHMFGERDGSPPFDLQMVSKSGDCIILVITHAHTPHTHTSHTHTHTHTHAHTHAHTHTHPTHTPTHTHTHTHTQECMKSTFDFIVQNCLPEGHEAHQHPGLSKAGKPFQFFYDLLKQIRSVIFEDKEIYGPTIAQCVWSFVY